MRHRVRELLKDLLIILLALSIVALTLLALPARTLTQTPWLASLLAPLTSVLGMERIELTQTQSQEADPAASQPIAISVMGAAGRSSIGYDTAALDSAYAALGSLLAQALDTAQPGQSSTRARLYDALQNAQSVAFLYPGSIPAQAVAAWLGAELPDSAPAAWLYALSVQDGAVQLYLLGTDVWVYSTQLPADALTQALSAYLPDGSFFAFESAEPLYAQLDSCTLLPGTSPTVYAAAGQNPCDSRFVTTLASALGFNPYGDASYTDDAGNRYFTETACSLQIYTDGRLRLRSRDAARFPAGATADSQISAARALLTTLLTGVTSDARLYLTGTASTEDGSGTVYTFDYVLSGLRIAQTSGSGARVTIQDGHITEVDALLRSYTLTENTLALLPVAQAAAILPAGTRMQLCYAASGTQQLTAGWTD